MIREIVLDTETTGLDPNDGHRIVEIGCVELANHLPTGRRFQRYLNPERAMTADALAVHGLSEEMLSKQPIFAEVVADLLEFLGDAQLVIHNAEFDMRFLNAELRRLGFPPVPMTRAVDTVRMARRKFPGAPASLDALCKRFNIDNSSRTLHGALLDAELLAEVYLELVGGRQPGLELAAETAAPTALTGGAFPAAVNARPARPHAPTPEEASRHDAFIDKLAKQAPPIWRN